MGNVTGSLGEPRSIDMQAIDLALVRPIKNVLTNELDRWSFEPAWAIIGRRRTSATKLAQPLHCNPSLTAQHQ